MTLPYEQYVVHPVVTEKGRRSVEMICQAAQHEYLLRGRVGFSMAGVERTVHLMKHGTPGRTHIGHFFNRDGLLRMLEEHRGAWQ